MRTEVKAGFLAMLVGVGAFAGCTPPDSTGPNPSSSAGTPSASASADPTSLASRAQAALAAIAPAAGSGTVGSVVVRPGAVEAMIVKGASAERWSVVNGSPVLALAAAPSTESGSLAAASFPLGGLDGLRSAVATCPTDYTARVQVLPSRGVLSSLSCGGGESNPVSAQLLGGSPLGGIGDRFAVESLAEIFREASAIAPSGQVLSIDLAGGAGAKTRDVAIALPAYDAGGYQCAPATWTRPLAGGDKGFLIAAPCVAAATSPTAEQLLAPSAIDPESVVAAIAEAKTQLGSDLSGATSVRLTMTGSGVVLQADDKTGASSGSAYVRLLPPTPQ